MNMNRFLSAGSFLLAACLASTVHATMDDDLFRPFSLVSGSEQLTAVSSKVFNGYVRDRDSEGKFRRETYTFGKGGQVSSTYFGFAGVSIGGARPVHVRGAFSDPSIDNISFDDIAHTIARPLAEQNYVASRDADGTQILIMVYWGRAEGSYLDGSGNAMDYIDGWNAQLMGFDADPFIKSRIDVSTVFLGRSLRSMMIDELHSAEIAALQADRYFVIMQAFDFQSARQHKKIKLLWETRFSLSERQHDFTRELPTMAHTASLYFGQDTQGLIRARIPEGQVDVGSVKSLGTVPENQ